MYIRWDISILPWCFITYWIPVSRVLSRGFLARWDLPWCILLSSQHAGCNCCEATVSFWALAQRIPTTRPSKNTLSQLPSASDCMNSVKAGRREHRWSHKQNDLRLYDLCSFYISTRWSLLPSYQVSNLNTTSQKHAKTIMYKTLQNDMLFHRRVINQPLCWVCQDGYDRICVSTLFHGIWETNAHMSYVYTYYNGEWGYGSPK